MSTAPPLLVCPECDAVQGARGDRCWLCGHRFAEAAEEEVVEAKLVEDPPLFRADLASAIAAPLLLLGVLAILAVGIGADDVDNLIPFAIFVGPALIVTFIWNLVRAARGRQTGLLSWILPFIASVAITAGVISLLVVAAVALFLIWCFGALATGSL